MKNIVLLWTSLLISLFAIPNESKICKSCHPTIYNEYYESSHRKASTVNNPIHKAYWEKFPKSKKGYTCAKCHSPSDTLAVQSGKLTENSIQRDEPISCVFCHTIKSVDSGEMENKNISTGAHKEFYTAQIEKKGEDKAAYKTETSWFGLVKKTENSPYHKIDYNNENYYTGKVCMGCHSHTNNEHNLDIIMLDAFIDKKDKHTCISCHMPQVAGTKVTLHQSKTHAYHGIAGIHNMNEEMGKYISFDVNKTKDGFTLDVINHANHALFGQVYREGKLFVSIEREGKMIHLKPFSFIRILGKNKQHALPWDANEVLKDTLIYNHRKLHYSEKLQAGDKLFLKLGVQMLSKEGQKVLGLEDPTMSDLHVLKKEVISF
jgi:hypothetical protein